MSAKGLTIVVSSVACLWLGGSTAAGQQTSLVPEVGYPLEFRVSQPVRDLPPQPHVAGPPKEIPMHRPPARQGSASVTDPVLQTSTPTPSAAQSLQQWEGLGGGYPGFSVTAVPP